MNGRMGFLRRSLYAVAVLGALGFGAAQAFGSPTPPSAARACNDTECNWECEQLGAGYGYCDEYGQCQCLL